ncbi:hypothetical protein K502DRAFT_340371 [Neoconidiobolus thromboides FSU 785]|nr:hypothetical protein K502DRAFT_340371 [Neoconidiobolus thromboides FSU 785]
MKQLKETRLRLEDITSNGCPMKSLYLDKTETEIETGIKSNQPELIEPLNNDYFELKIDQVIVKFYIKVGSDKDSLTISIIEQKRDLNSSDLFEQEVMSESTTNEIPLVTQLKVHFNNSKVLKYQIEYNQRHCYLMCLLDSLEYQCFELNLTSVPTVGFKEPLLLKQHSTYLKRYSVFEIKYFGIVDLNSFVVCNQNFQLIYFQFNLDNGIISFKELKIPFDFNFNGLVRAFNLRNNTINNNTQNQVIQHSNIMDYEGNVNKIITLHCDGKLRVWDLKEQVIVFHYQIEQFSHQNNQMNIYFHQNIYYLIVSDKNEKQKVQFFIYKFQISHMEAVHSFHLLDKVNYFNLIQLNNPANNCNTNVIDFILLFNNNTIQLYGLFEINQLRYVNSININNYYNQQYNNNNDNMIDTNDSIIINEQIINNNNNEWNSIILENSLELRIEKKIEQIKSQQKIENNILEFLFELSTFGSFILRDTYQRFILKYNINHFQLMNHGINNNKESIYLNIVKAMNYLFSLELSNNNNNNNNSDSIEGIKENIWIKFLKCSLISLKKYGLPIKFYFSPIINNELTTNNNNNESSYLPKLIYNDGLSLFTTINYSEFLYYQLFNNQLFNLIHLFQFNINQQQEIIVNTEDYNNSYMSINNSNNEIIVNGYTSNINLNQDLISYMKLIEVIEQSINEIQLQLIESQLIELLIKNQEFNLNFIDVIQYSILKWEENNHLFLNLELELISISNNIHHLSIHQFLLDYLFNITNDQEANNNNNEDESNEDLIVNSLLELSELNYSIYSKLNSQSKLSPIIIILLITINNSQQLKINLKLEEEEFNILDSIRYSTVLMGIYHLFFKPLILHQNHQINEENIQSLIQYNNNQENQMLIYNSIKDIQHSTLFFDYFKKKGIEIQLMKDPKLFIKQLLNYFIFKKEESNNPFYLINDQKTVNSISLFLADLIKYLIYNNYFGHSILLSLLCGNYFYFYWIQGIMFYLKKDYSKSFDYFKDAINLYSDYNNNNINNNLLLVNLIQIQLPSFHYNINSSYFFYLLAKKYHEDGITEYANLIMEQSISLFLDEVKITDEDIIEKQTNEYYYFKFELQIELKKYDSAVNFIPLIRNPIIKKKCIQILLNHIVEHQLNFDLIYISTEREFILLLLWEKLIYLISKNKETETIEQWFNGILQFYLLNLDYTEAATTLFHQIIYYFTQLSKEFREFTIILQKMLKNFKVIIEIIEQTNLSFNYFKIKKEFLKEYQMYMLNYINEFEKEGLPNRIVSFQMVLKYCALVQSTLKLYNNSIYEIKKNQLLTYNEIIEGYCLLKNYTTCFQLTQLFEQKLTKVFFMMIENVKQLIEEKNNNKDNLIKEKKENELLKLLELIKVELKKQNEPEYYILLIQQLLQDQIMNIKDDFVINILNELYELDFNQLIRLLISYNYLEIGLKFTVDKMNLILSNNNLKLGLPILCCDLLYNSLKINNDIELLNQFEEKINLPLKLKMKDLE